MRCDLPYNSHQAKLLPDKGIGMSSLPQALATALEKNSTVTAIDLGGKSIGDEGAKARVLSRHLLHWHVIPSPGTRDSA